MSQALPCKRRGGFIGLEADSWRTEFERRDSVGNTGRLRQNGARFVAETTERFEVIAQDGEVDRRIGRWPLLKRQGKETRAGKRVTHLSLYLGDDLVRALVTIQLDPASGKAFDAFCIVDHVVIDAR